MQDLETLYSRAVVTCGTEYKLAQRLGVKQSTLSRRKSDKPLSPELWALIADIAGEDATAALVAATVQRNMGKERGGWLREALGKSLAAGVVGTLLTLGSATDANASGDYASMRNHLLYIGAATLICLERDPIDRWLVRPTSQR